MANTPRLKKSISATRHDIQAHASSESAASQAYDIVARHAYDLYLARGCAPGHDVEDWLQAERELQAARPAAPAPQTP